MGIQGGRGVVVKDEEPFGYSVAGRLGKNGTLSNEGCRYDLDFLPNAKPPMPTMADKPVARAAPFIPLKSAIATNMVIQTIAVKAFQGIDFSLLSLVY
ncbi:hypothetical protein ES703_22441 [subsurface metagenome]